MTTLKIPCNIPRWFLTISLAKIFSSTVISRRAVTRFPQHGFRSGSFNQGLNTAARFFSGGSRSERLVMTSCRTPSSVPKGDHLALALYTALFTSLKSASVSITPANGNTVMV